MIGKKGRILSWTIIRVPPGGFASFAPYPVVIVALDGGGHITAQLVDWEQKHLTIGQPVMTVVRRITETKVEDVIPYGVKVKPIW